MIYWTVDRADGAKLFVDVDSEKGSATLTARIPGQRITVAVVCYGAEQCASYVRAFSEHTNDLLFSSIRDAPETRKFTVTEIGRKKVSETP